MFLLDYIYIFCLNCQGLVGLAALLVKTVEKFQALQAQVVDIAAQQVQRQVQCVADHGNDDKQDHVAEGGRQGVEHLGDHAAGQHQGHKADIGQNIAEIAGDAVVNGADEPLTTDTKHVEIIKEEQSYGSIL